MSMTSPQNTRKKREALFRDLYLKAFPSVASYISKRGGNLEQAKDTFQESLIIYYEQVELAKKPIRKNAKAYILGVVRHLWYQQTQNDVQSRPLDSLTKITLETPGEPISRQKLLRVLETAGRKCMDMLRAFYYEQQPLDQIAAQFGFGSTRSATVQKYKCLEKVRKEVKENALTYADFTE